MQKKTLAERMTVLILSGVCVALAGMCVGLAFAWKAKNDEAECWKAAAMYQLQPEGACRG